MPIELRRQLPALWADLLTREILQMTVIEDLDRAHPDGIEAFGATVFLEDRFIDDVCVTPRPYFATEVYRRVLDNRSPLLSPARVRAANSTSGLNLAVLHFGLRQPALDRERSQRALQVGSAGFFFFHAGFRLNVLVQEVYGREQAAYMRAGGFRLVSDFAGQLTGGEADSDTQPHLFALDRQSVTPAAVSPLTFLFHRPDPRLGFTEAEQRVLVRALLNEPDLRIAQSLSVSIDTVKKTWRSIYARVAQHAPYLMPAAEGGGSGRALEKRRHVLDYVRTHLEEVRPFERRRRGPA
jgi:hypothetical protein